MATDRNAHPPRLDYAASSDQVSRSAPACLITNSLGPRRYLWPANHSLPHTEYGYGLQRRSSTLRTTHHPQNCRLLSPFTIPQHNSSSISARLYAYSAVQTGAWRTLTPRFLLSASSLFSLKSQEQTDLDSWSWLAAPIGGRRRRNEYQTVVGTHVRLFV